MIKILLWDIDATLLDFLKSESMALKKAFLHFGLGECPDSKVAEYSAINQSYWNRLETGELNKEQVLVGRFEEFLSVNGYNDVDAEKFCEYYESSLPITLILIIPLLTRWFITTIMTLRVLQTVIISQKSRHSIKDSSAMMKRKQP